VLWALTGALLAARVGAQPANLTLLKSALYVQDSSRAPVPDPERPFAFEARVSSMLLSLTDPQTVSVTLGRPGLPDVAMGYSITANAFVYTEGFQTLEGMNAAWPAGDYAAHILGVLPVSIDIEVSLADLAPPPAPWVLNASDASMVSVSGAFEVQASPPPDNAPIDQLNLSLTTPDGIVVLNRDAAATAGRASIAIPAGTLRTGVSYAAALNFERNAGQSATLDGRVGSSTVSSRTSFALKTPLEPHLKSWLDSSGFHLRFNASPQSTYRLETSTDLQTWNEVEQVVPSGPYYDLTELLGSDGTWSFFRVQLLTP
jgi:hypothetical protein